MRPRRAWIWCVLPLLTMVPFAAAPPPDAPPLVRYRLTERSRALSPAGERSSGTSGVVSVSGDRARWQLEGGTFPKAKASVLLSDRGGLTLLDPAEKVFGQAPVDGLDALFGGAPAGDSGLASFHVKDLKVSAAPAGAGPSFQGMPVSKTRVDLSWTLVFTSPGRVGRTKSDTHAVVETVDGWDDARSPFDGLTRLFAFRGEVKEALERELSAIRGFPVAVSLDTTTESSAEPAGPAGPGELLSRPLKTSRSASRSVSGLTRRKGTREDDALFGVPDDFHARGLERFLTGLSAVP